MPRYKRCFRTDDNKKTKDTETTIVFHTENRISDQEERKSTCLGLYIEGELNKNDLDLQGILGTDAEKEPFFYLPFFTRSMFATVLEDLITAFDILGECTNLVRVLKVKHDMPVLKTHKFGIEDPHKESDLDKINPKELGCVQYKLAKLEKDRNDVSDVIKTTYQAIIVRCTFRPLWNYCQEATEREQFSLILKNDAFVHKGDFRNLTRQLRQQRIQQRSSLYDFDVKIDTLEKIIQDADQTGSIQERYVEKWQSSRTEQHAATIKEKEEVYSKSSEHHKKHMEQELIVHNEIETLVAVAIEENLQKIEDMMEKYDSDMERMDLRLQIMRSDLMDVVYRRKVLEDKIKTREKEMKDWIQFKADREERVKYEKTMQKSAITVQAWWRGFIVRHKLGPYRPRKERRKKK